MKAKNPCFMPFMMKNQIRPVPPDNNLKCLKTYVLLCTIRCFILDTNAQFLVNAQCYNRD